MTPTDRARTALVLSAFAYPFMVALILALTLNNDPWAMFQISYWVLCFGALPLVWMVFSVLAARRFGTLSWAWLLFHVGVVGLVTFGHFWLMAAFAAGV